MRRSAEQEATVNKLAVLACILTACGGTPAQPSEPRPDVAQRPAKAERAAADSATSRSTAAAARPGAAASLYDEAAELLLRSFSLKDGELGTRLGGQSAAHGANFIELLAPERRASIFQPVSADSETNAKLLKALLAFALLSDPEANGGTIDAERAAPICHHCRGCFVRITSAPILRKKSKP